MRIKYTIFTLFLFVFTFGSFLSISSLGYNEAKLANANSNSDDEAEYTEEIEDSIDDSNRSRARERDGVLGVPVRQEVRERLRTDAPEIEDSKIRERVKDFDKNNIVGWSDLRILINNWGACRFVPTNLSETPSPDAASTSRYCSGDTNQDGIVDVLDLEEIIASWNESGDNGHVLEILEICRGSNNTDEQRKCLLKSFQDKEVKLKTERTKVAWKARDGGNDESVEKRVENYLRHMSNMITKMYAAIERLEVLSQRIDSRIVKLEERGLDMTNAKNLLSEVQNKIDETRVEVKNLSETYEDVVETEDPKELFEEIKSEVQNIRNILKDIHLSLIEIVRSMKSTSEDEVESSDDIEVTN